MGDRRRRDQDRVGLGDRVVDPGAQTDRGHVRCALREPVGPDQVLAADRHRPRPRQRRALGFERRVQRHLALGREEFAGQRLADGSGAEHRDPAQRRVLLQTGRRLDFREAGDERFEFSG